MRSQATLDLLPQLCLGDLEGVYVRPAECQEEVRPSHAGDLGGLALRDHPLPIPLDGRGQSDLADEILIRTPEEFGQIVRNFQLDDLQTKAPSEIRQLPSL
jgi:hypothetical protein